MSDLLWPGAERAGDLFSDEAMLRAMVAVEQAWLDSSADAHLAPQSVALAELVGPADLAEVSAGAESAGNPVPGLVSLLRARASGTTAPWIHRGLTSQDVIDSALMLCLREAQQTLLSQIATQVQTLQALATEHRATVMVGRTLTQAAVPITFGLKAATWLSAVVQVGESLQALAFPVQLGGAAGTQAAAVELASGDIARVEAVCADTATKVGLTPTPPWHTSRRPLTAISDAMVSATDAWGRIAQDVLTLSRNEISELAEGAGGGSSTMPHKQNPALSVLIARAAITAPSYAGLLHLASALAHDERSAGPWHVEWSALRSLARLAVIAGSQTTAVISGLRVDAEQMRHHVSTLDAELRAEQQSMASFVQHEPLAGHYLGANDRFIDDIVAMADRYLKGE